MKIKEYFIVSSTSVISLAIKVNEYIKKGWQPWGDMRNMPGNYCCQAMVRYEE